ncbi:MAG: hypothetical protein RLY71_4654 [Pseudomonadota bacterium]|jgi:hypothetical protein
MNRWLTRLRTPPAWWLLVAALAALVWTVPMLWELALIVALAAAVWIFVWPRNDPPIDH